MTKRIVPVAHAGSMKIKLRNEATDTVLFFEPRIAQVHSAEGLRMLKRLVTEKSVRADIIRMVDGDGICHSEYALSNGEWKQTR